MLGPTVNAVLEGSVQGVVVQARTKSSPSPFRKSGRESSMVLNWATMVVSVTSR